MWKSKVFVGVALVATLLLPVMVQAQGYGSLDEDDDAFAPNVGNPQFPQNQQASALPQYDSLEQPGIPGVPPVGPGGAGRRGQGLGGAGRGVGQGVGGGAGRGIGGVGGGVGAPGRIPGQGGAGAGRGIGGVGGVGPGGRIPGQAAGGAGLGVGAGVGGGIGAGGRPAAGGAGLGIGGVGGGVGAGGRPAAGRNNQNNPWWQGQNAFQRPAGHPGVEQLAPETNYNAYGGSAAPVPPVPNQQRPFPNPTPGIPPTLPGGQPQYNVPPVDPSATGYIPGSEEDPFEEPIVSPSPPYNVPPPVQNNPQVPVNNPPYNRPPSPPYTAPSPGQPPYNPPYNAAAANPVNQVPPTPPYGAPDYTGPVQPNPQVQGFGWNAPKNTYQQPKTKPGFGQPDEIEPGCDLLNKEDCHRGQRIPSVGPPAIPDVNSPFEPQPTGLNPQRPRQPTIPPQKPRPRPQPRPTGPQIYNPSEKPYPGCAAALLCVPDEMCDMKGLISDQALSAADKLYRVALVQCSDPMSGGIGVCCRDPNYVDPWPDMQGKKPPVKGQTKIGAGQQSSNNMAWARKERSRIQCTNSNGFGAPGVRNN